MSSLSNIVFNQFWCIQILSCLHTNKECVMRIEKWQHVSLTFFWVFFLLIETLRSTNEPDVQVWVLVHISCVLRWVVVCFGACMMSLSSEEQVRSKWGANHKKHIKSHTNNLWPHHNTHRDWLTCTETKITGWVIVRGSTAGVGDSFVAESALHFFAYFRKSNVAGFKNDRISLASSNFDAPPISKSIKTVHF